MTARRTNVVTSTDVALLRSLAQDRSIAGASRRVGISRDRAVYRVERLERAFGGPVVVGVRGGSGHGGSTLTALGDRIVWGGLDSVELLDAHLLTPLPPPISSTVSIAELRPRRSRWAGPSAFAWRSTPRTGKR